jgi:hypothetical protein
MSEKAVDLGLIRGNWDFHARYVANAMEQTLKRANKCWRALKARSPAAGQVPVDTQLMEEFIESCSQTRALCDDFLLLADIRPKAARRKAAGKKRKPARKK